ncbi:MAG: hypothetical protein AAFR61_25250 [Bacteroidota bacterium]
MNKKIILGVIVIGLATAGYIGWRMFDQKVPSLADEKAFAQVSATDLFAEFSTDEAAANTKYVDKVVSVTGKIATAPSAQDSIVVLNLETGDLMGGINCAFEGAAKDDLAGRAVGEEITVKGMVAGMLMDVSLVRCVVEK